MKNPVNWAFGFAQRSAFFSAPPSMVRPILAMGLLVQLILPNPQARAHAIPFCLDQQRQTLPINNSQPMEWKFHTRDQFKARAYVQGELTQLYPDRTGHTHFAIDLDGKPGGDIEIIYNQNFGSLPPLRVGMMVQACGDYITVGPQAHRPSPMGAIIHWVHYNPGDRDGGRHPHGFLVIQGKVYGFSSQTSGSSH
jgi:hypothetical protein